MQIVKTILVRTFPWIITVVALYFAFTGLEWELLFQNLRNADIGWLITAVLLTCLSYLLRSQRWRLFFPRPVIDFLNAAKVLILGFFMNNVLPARTGELVRAHLGSKVTGEKRTLVLATIASERLVDGITLSVFFLVFGVGAGLSGYAEKLTYVVLGFFLVLLGVVVVFALREKIFRLSERLGNKLNHRASDFALDRVQVFIDGLAPLCTWHRFVPITLWSLFIWGVELLVYVSIGIAFHQELTLSQSVLFLVAVNFSSLVPSAPGAIGVIEFIATQVLVSVGLVRTVALAMVVSQHVIQYLVVGLPGIYLAFSFRSRVGALQAPEEETV